MSNFRICSASGAEGAEKQKEYILLIKTKSFWQENEFFSSYYETSEKPRGIAEWFWSMLSNKREEKEFDVVKK